MPSQGSEDEDGSSVGSELEGSSVGSEDEGGSEEDGSLDEDSSLDETELDEDCSLDETELDEDCSLDEDSSLDACDGAESDQALGEIIQMTGGLPSPGWSGNSNGRPGVQLAACMGRSVSSHPRHSK